MSQATSTAQFVTGNTARALPGWEPRTERSTATRRRAPLSLVAPAAARKRVPFVVFCFLVLVAALAAVLVLNISVSTGQYALVQLSNQQVALQQENQALTHEAENHRAPQNLAAEAAELGMVASPSFGSIDLQTLRVSGDPKPAEEGEKPLVLVPAPEAGPGTEPTSEGQTGQ